MGKLSILLACEFYAPSVGGVQEVMRQIAERLVDRGHSVIVPDEEELQLCVDAIAAVKGNRPDDAFAPAAACIRRLVARGAEAVVLGCTELPLAVPHAQRAALGTVLTDSIDALARAAIERFGATQR